MKQRRTGLTSTTRAAFIAVILASASTAGLFVDDALAGPRVPSPTIISSPSTSTTLTTAVFTFSDSEQGVTFRCSLDSSAFVPCTSGTTSSTYSGLALSSHTFSVEAVSSSMTSSAASASWAILQPTPTILSGPGSWTANTSATFTYSDGRAGESSHCSLDGSLFNLCSSNTVRTDSNTVRTDEVTTANLTFDTAVPPPPVLVSEPKNPTPTKTAEFEFTDSNSDVSFICMLGNATPTPCSHDYGRNEDNVSCGGESYSVGNAGNRGYDDHSVDHGGCRGEVTYSNLAPGATCFYVTAADDAGNVSPSTTFCWTINRAIEPFTISGNIVPLLSPGTSQPLDLVFTNPNTSPITIASGAITIVISTTQAGCVAATNFAVTKGLTASATVPARSTRSLSELGIGLGNWPLISMIETHTNQNACESATLTLTYSGTAVDETANGNFSQALA